MQTSFSAGRVAKPLVFALAGLASVTVLTAGSRMSSHAGELSQTIEDQVSSGAPPWLGEVSAWSFHERARRFAEARTSFASTYIASDECGRAAKCSVFSK